jgi:tripartite-type tricarboxylate transporter receptor subunit TctC
MASTPMMTLLKSTTVQVLLMTLASLAFALAPRLALDQESWPSGDIELIIPSGPGGGFDTYARILARAMEARLDVNVIPKNTSGGDGQRGATVAYTARPDGQTFAVFNLPGIIEPEITGDEVGYDIARIDWLGAMALNQYIVVVAADSPYNTIADLTRAGEPILFTAYGSSGIAANKVLCAEVGLDCQIITGYSSNTEALLGVVRGDAAASVPPISTATAFNRNGDLKGILLMTDREAPAFTETQKASDAGYSALVELGLLRAFGLPPGVPAEIRDEFSAVFDRALAEDSVTSWAAATGAEFTPMSADELLGRIQSQRALLSRYRDVIAGDH